MKYFKHTLLFIIIINAFSLVAQDSFKDKFEGANVLMEEKQYRQALPILKSLLKEDPNNANLNFKIGECYYYSARDRKKALPYFQKAAKNIKTNYDPLNYLEKAAKVDAYYYLAHTYHIENEIDSAIHYFKLFDEKAAKKHYLKEDLEHQLQMCYTAKEMMKNPIDITIENLGPGINTSAPEYGSVLSLDENTIYFTSRRLRADSSNIYYKESNDGLYFEDVYVSYHENGHWTNPQLLDFNVPNDHTATINLTADGQTLFVYQDDDGVGHLYESHYLGSHWTTPEKLGSDINAEGNDVHVAVSPDEKMLLFISDRKGGKGGKDIWRCLKLPNGEWSLAKNIGEPLNTKYDEDGIFFHPDGKTIYFSSNGHQSMGGYDIFSSTLQEDGTFSEPVNIGYPINTTDDDVFFVTSANGLRGYYSSNHEGGYGDQDIYMITFNDATQKHLTLLKGFIKPEEGQALPEDIKVYLTDNETGELVAQARPQARNGSYVFIIPPGKNYNLSYEANGNEFYNENIYVPYGTEYTEIDKEIYLNTISMTGRTVDVKEGEGALQRWKVRYKTLDKDIPENLVIDYIDSEGNILYKEPVDKNGFFAYHEIPADIDYTMIIDTKDHHPDHNICDDLEMILLSEGYHDENYVLLPDADCNFQSKSHLYGLLNLEKLCKDIPENLKVQYVDNNGLILFEEPIGKDGHFKYHDLPKDKYTMRLMEGDNPYECDGNLTMNILGGDSPLSLKSGNGCEFAHSLDMLDTTEEKMDKSKEEDSSLVDTKEKDQPKASTTNDKITMDTPNKLAFEEYFGYNKNIPTKEQEFQKFIKSFAETIAKEGKASISIESSASRVPTKTYGSNSKLAKLRAEKCKDKLYESLKKLGVDTSKVKVVNMTTLVQGPKYKGDFKENRATYEKFQYVKVFIN